MNRQKKMEKVKAIPNLKPNKLCNFQKDMKIILKKIRINVLILNFNKKEKKD